MSKHLYRTISILCAAVSIIGCSGELPTQRLQPTIRDNQIYTFEAVLADNLTKTVIQDETSVYWSPADSITIFNGSISRGKFVGTNETAAATTSFKGRFTPTGSSNSEESVYFWGLYPYSKSANCIDSAVTVEVPALQTAMEGSFAPNLFPMIARSTEMSFDFYNVCGGVMFTVSRDSIISVTFKGNGNEIIAGGATVGMDSEGKPQVISFTDGIKEITVNAPDEGYFKVGAKYFLVAYPTTLSNGWSITYNKANADGTYTSTNEATIKRSVFGKLENMDKGIVFTGIEELTGGANCFVIPNYTKYFFDATKKGNSEESVGEIASAEVLWESFGTGTAPSIGDIVSNVRYRDGKVFFTASGKDGNAVIAVKDADGNILWSWHIWVCKDFDPIATAQSYKNDAGLMMDRNLGALSATPGDLGALGLLYQWGRKDPFLGNLSVTSESPYGTSAESTITWPHTATSDESDGTIAFSVANPTRFITCNSCNNDWYYTGSAETDNTRWQASDKAKTMYDPCPSGWRVPDGGDNSVWAKALDRTEEFSKGPWDSTNRGMNFGSGNGKDTSMQLGEAETIWYPATGCRSFSVGGVKYPGSNGYYWTCSPCDSSALCFFFDLTAKVVPSSARERAAGRSVRCIRE